MDAAHRAASTWSSSRDSNGRMSMAYALCYHSTDTVHPGTRANPHFAPVVVFIGPHAHVRFQGPTRHETEDEAGQRAKTMCDKLQSILCGILGSEGWTEGDK